MGSEKKNLQCFGIESKATETLGVTDFSPCFQGEGSNLKHAGLTDH